MRSRFVDGVGAGGEATVEHEREVRYAPRLLRVDVVALHELRYRDIAHVVMLEAAQQVVEYALAHRAVRHRQRADPQLRQRRAHDREPPRQHRQAVAPQALQVEALDVSCLDQRCAQPVETVRRDSRIRVAIQLQDLGQRARGARRRHRLFPVAGGEARNNGLQLAARGKLSLLHRVFRYLAVRKVFEAVAHAAHVNAFELERFERAADDELGRTAADVDYQALVLGHRQAVRHAEVDQARFLAPRYHLDRTSQCRFGLFQEPRGILRDGQRIGADRAPRVRVEAAQPFAEALQAFERALLRVLVEALIARQSRADTDGLAPGS